MAKTLEYDDTQLRQLFAEMDEKQRAKAMKGAFRSTANLLRRTAVANLRSDLHSGKDLEKGVRALVFKQKLGFRVTVGTVLRKSKDRTRIVAKKGFHLNRAGLEKPVLIWAEDGTKERRLKGSRGSHRTKTGFRKRYLFNGAFRGRMPAYQFIVKANQQVGPQINQTLQESFRASVEKTAKKYGCIV